MKEYGCRTGAYILGLVSSTPLHANRVCEGFNMYIEQGYIFVLSSVPLYASKAWDGIHG